MFTIEKRSPRLRQNVMVLSAISALLFGFSNAASAAATYADCSVTGSYNIADNVSPTTGCTILEPLDANVNDGGNADVVNDANDPVNPNGFFGFEDWAFEGKAEEGSNSSSLFNFTRTFDEADWTGGTFTKAGSWVVDDFANIMLVFKDGDDTNLVGYLLNIADFLDPLAYNGVGNYSSPFELPPFVATHGNATLKGISHITVYTREGDGGDPRGDCLPGDTRPECNTPGVPEPNQLALLGIGLFSMGALRKFRIAMKA